MEVLGSKFRLDIRKNFSKITLRQRHRVPREVVETLPLDVFGNCMDVALRDVVQWYGRDGLTAELDDLSDLSNLNDQPSL